MQAFTNPGENADDKWPGDGSLMELLVVCVEVFQIDARNPFHGDIIAIVCAPQIVNGHDIRVMQLGRESGFVEKQALFGFFFLVLVSEFDDDSFDEAVGSFLFCEPNRAHSAFA
jgi:hypothetical protein